MHSTFISNSRGTICRALLDRSLECGGSTPLLRLKLSHTNLSPSADFTWLRILSFFLKFLCALCLSVAAPFSSSAQQPQLNIAAAADLKFAMTDLASAYEKQSGAH